MKRNFNIFQSYNSGSEKDLASVVQLEDNLTRALLVTLSNLERPTQHLIVTELFQLENLDKTEDIKYDLQNPTSKLPLAGKQKTIVTIQRYASKIKKDDFVQNIEIINIILKDYNVKEKRAIKEIIVSAEKNDNDLNKLTAYGMADVKPTMLASILNLIGDNRADGWIITNNNVILIEAKIGDNEVSKYQLYRHLSKKNGFGIAPSSIQKGNKCQDYLLRHITWDDTYNLLKSIEDQHVIKGKDRFMIKQFLNYLEMNGEVLDFSSLVHNGLIDKDYLKSQFKLFLDKFDKRIANNPYNLRKAGRPHDYLWDSFGLVHEREVLSDPHYTISFNESKLGIALTLSNDILNASLFNKSKDRIVEECLKMISGKTEKRLEQYYIGLQKYRLVDRKGNSQKGETFNTFNLFGRLSDILKRKDTEELRKNALNVFLSTFPYLIKLEIGKQFEIGIQIDLLQFKKVRANEPMESQLRAINKDLLENPEKLIEQFYAFIEDTYELFKDFALLQNKKAFKAVLNSK